MLTKTSRFFAYLNRLRLIKRWGLMRNTQEENVMEHSWQVSTIAHALAVISKEKFNQDISPETVATTALYHDCSEIITGDMPTPVKYHSETIANAYKEIESEAEYELLNLLPDSLQPSFSKYLLHQEIPADVALIVKAADRISAYLKCQSELDAGNKEFTTALEEIEKSIRKMKLPAVEFFMGTFVESYQLTLDELLKQHDEQIKD